MVERIQGYWSIKVVKAANLRGGLKYPLADLSSIWTVTRAYREIRHRQLGLRNNFDLRKLGVENQLPIPGQACQVPRVSVIGGLTFKKNNNVSTLRHRRNERPPQRRVSIPPRRRHRQAKDHDAQTVYLPRRPTAYTRTLDETLHHRDALPMGDHLCVSLKG